MIIMNQCAFCKHFQGHQGVKSFCAAYPKGIPRAILENRHDHRLPYSGDHGIRWEQDEESLQSIGPISLFEPLEEPAEMPVVAKAS